MTQEEILASHVKVLAEMLKICREKFDGPFGELIDQRVSEAMQYVDKPKD